MKTSIRIYKIAVLLLISILTTGQAFCQTEVICEEILLKCIGRTSQGVIVMDEMEYKAIQNPTINYHHPGNPSLACVDFEYPEIDFEKYVLVGYSATTGGCRGPYYGYKVMQEESTYTIHAEIIQNGLCKRNNPIRFWLLLPKLGDDMLIKFESSKTVNGRLLE